MLRLARPVLIGAGGALAAGGLLYALQEYRLSQARYLGHISPEWSVETRSHIYRASAAPDAATRASELSKAVGSLVSSSTNLRTKSSDWLAGYGDLMAKLGVALAAVGDEDTAVEALTAAGTIPHGSTLLKAEAAVAMHELGRLSGPELADLYSQLDQPTNLGGEDELRAFGPLAITVGRYRLQAGETNRALNELLRFHRSATARSDPLCLRQTAGGYIAQAFWKLGDKDSARAWLDLSEKEAAKCSTNACRETLAVLRDLKARAAKY